MKGPGTRIESPGSHMHDAIASRQKPTPEAVTRLSDVMGIASLKHLFENLETNSMSDGPPPSPAG
ncbi:hypothetical protein BPOR_0273g00050 [Botrytis porri]|uniref:Uncharacterized protein n=1 Tax=Botrytis porri TaxID=87229 RepID=A0A4Z1KNA0_9HELO|nr:hypothetical protein BPOR_0273g00050 [Botrytis porri]